MATGLPVIRLSRPFAAKSAANWVMKRVFFTGRYVKKPLFTLRSLLIDVISSNIDIALIGFFLLQ